MSTTLEIVIQGEDRASSAFNAAGESAKGFGGHLADIGSMALGVLGGNLITGALGKITGALSEGMTGAREAAQVFAQSEAVIKSTGGAAGVTAEQVRDYSGALSDAAGKSLFSGEQVSQSENLLLTFTNIKGKSLEAATAISVDLAQAMGGAPKDAAVQLGKALNDPTKGLTALTRVGVTFDDEQKKLIKTYQEHGDMAKAQGIILAELNKEFGGSAAAAAKAAGGGHQFKAAFDDAVKGVVGSFLPTLDKLGAVLASPEVLGAMQRIADVISNTLARAITWITTTGIPGMITAWHQIQPAIALVRDAFLTFSLALSGNWTNSDKVLLLHQAFGTLGTFIHSTVIPAFQTVTTFVQANTGPVLAGLAGALLTVVVPAFVAWAVAAGAAAIATITALAPVLLPIAAIGVAAGLLYAAWNTNFFGIRDTLTAVWTNTLQPAFVTIKDWLATNIPIALQTLADFWNNTLLPAITAVWTFLDTYVIPLFRALVNVEFAALKLALTALAGIWQNVLMPALQAVWDFISKNVNPILSSLADIFTTHVSPSVQSATSLFGGFSGVMGSIGGLVKDAIGWLNGLADRLGSLKLPDWMVRHSPAPVEQTLMGMNDQLKTLTGDQLPAFVTALASQEPGTFYARLVDILTVTTNLAQKFIDWATFMGDPFAAALDKAGTPIDKLHSKVDDLSAALQHAIDRMEILARLKPGKLPSGGDGGAGAGGDAAGQPRQQPGSQPGPSDPGQDSRAHGGNQPGAAPGPSDPGQGDRARSATRLSASSASRPGGGTTTTNAPQYHLHIHSNAKVEPLVADFQMLKSWGSDF